MSLDKNHYYDGKLYDWLFCSALTGVRRQIIRNVEPNSKVLDIACGTGALVFELAGKCQKVVGVELSSKMVAYASQKKVAKGVGNVEFIHADATNLPQFRDGEFDYATISMALHEMPPDIRKQILSEAKRVANKLVVADFTVPQPLNFAGIRSRIVEFLAGIDHFKGFLHFQRNGGLESLLEELDLSIEGSAVLKHGTIEVIKAQKKL